MLSIDRMITPHRVTKHVLLLDGSAIGFWIHGTDWTAIICQTCSSNRIFASEDERHLVLYLILLDLKVLPAYLARYIMPKKGDPTHDPCFPGQHTVLAVNCHAIIQLQRQKEVSGGLGWSDFRFERRVARIIIDYFLRSWGHDLSMENYFQ